MEIHQFPEVQIVGNDAHVREGSTYVHLGAYSGDNFIWSDEGHSRREKILKEKEPTPEPKTLESELAAAKARNTLRLNKAKGR